MSSKLSLTSLVKLVENHAYQRLDLTPRQLNVFNARLNRFAVQGRGKGDVALVDAIKKQVPSISVREYAQYVRPFRQSAVLSRAEFKADTSAHRNSRKAITANWMS